MFANAAGWLRAHLGCIDPTTGGAPLSQPESSGQTGPSGSQGQPAGSPTPSGHDDPPQPQATDDAPTVHFRPRVDAQAVLTQVGRAATAVSPSQGPVWHAALLAANTHELELTLTATLMSWLADNDLLPGTWLAKEPEDKE